nr:MAG TPA: hypothetical protein [Caudoviricetes sp.]
MHFLQIRSLAQSCHALWFSFSLNSPSTKDDSHHQWATENIITQYIVGTKVRDTKYVE